ncbi:hypothetical protein [Streptomyces gardneri]|uniref:hypothetical protein n=1 Tax=Streptomyces gardneri TaxID=66892 RepID=UPI0035D57F0B
MAVREAARRPDGIFSGRRKAEREGAGQDRLDVFCGFLREIGRRLGKPVLMDPEGDYGHSVLGFDVEADRVVLLADPQVS